MKSVCSNKTSI